MATCFHFCFVFCENLTCTCTHVVHVGVGGLDYIHVCIYTLYRFCTLVHVHMYIHVHSMYVYIAALVLIIRTVHVHCMLAKVLCISCVYPHTCTCTYTAVVRDVQYMCQCTCVCRIKSFTLISIVHVCLCTKYVVHVYTCICVSTCRQPCVSVTHHIQSVKYKCVLRITPCLYVLVCWTMYMYLYCSFNDNSFTMYSKWKILNRSYRDKLSQASVQGCNVQFSQLTTHFSVHLLRYKCTCTCTYASVS